MCVVVSERVKDELEEVQRNYTLKIEQVRGKLILGISALKWANPVWKCWLNFKVCFRKKFYVIFWKKKTLFDVLSTKKNIKNKN